MTEHTTTMPAFQQPSRAEEAANYRLLTISGLAVAIGALAGIIAFLLYHLIGLVSNLVFFHRVAYDLPHVRENLLGWNILWIPAAGGLIVGVMAKYGSSKIRGHGIPEAMEAVLFNRSKIAPRVALLKPLSAAIAIGTGGPFGAEGPIIQTGGAMGSLIGQALRVTAAERKVLLACGAAAGMAATFSTPIAAVILAIELLLFEFKSRSFIPLVIASTIATSIHIWLMGPGPMFDVKAVDFAIPRALPEYCLLGLLCGAVAVGFSAALYWVEDLFEKLPFDAMWWPALGGLALGIIGYFVPRVLGVGYDTISDILANNLAIKVLLLVLVFKGLALLITLSSGTSGGLLAPMFMMSAALGSCFAVLVNAIYPAAHLSPGAFAIVAMGAVFGAAARATFAFIIFAFEITRDYNSVLPLMLVCVIAQAVATLAMKNSIMTEKLARRGLRIHQEYEADVLEQVLVGEVMTREVPAISATMDLHDLAGRMSRADGLLGIHYALPLVDAQGRLAGIITQKDVLRAVESQAVESHATDAALSQPATNIRTVLDAGTRNVIVAYPDETVHDAATRMLRNDIGRLIVVERGDRGKVLGYLGRAGVMAARLRRVQEEHVRERGWMFGAAK